MRRLFQFIYTYRAFFLFLLLEVISGWLVVNHNDYLSASFFNSSNAFAGNVYENKQAVEDYFRLNKINERLAQENEALRNKLTFEPAIVDSSSFFTPTALAGQYDYTIATVVNNSVDRFRNYFTLDKGEADGVTEGMGVINGYGLIGKIKSTSKNYAVGYSALHSNLLISAVIEETKTLCTANWDGKNPRQISLEYVPRHIKLKNGMRIVTSGFNAIFPPGIKIGEIASVDIKDDATFYEVKVDLAVDFQSLDYVYVIGNELQQEQDSLENTIKLADD
jgi:rod shape-determining protein MreC